LFSNVNRRQDAKAQQEAAAASSLLGLHRQGKIRFLRSNIIRHEVERTPSAIAIRRIANRELPAASVRRRAWCAGLHVVENEPSDGHVGIFFIPIGL
jgi:hypothetical protein